MKLKTSTILGALAITGLATSALADAADLQVFDWSGYEDPGFFGAYVEKYGGPPSYTYFGSQEEAFTKLQSGFEADLAHPCSDAVRKWVAADLLQPIDTSKLTNWDKLLPQIKEVDGITIDGTTYMVPFEWGNTGLIYRTDMISGDDISLQLLADPAYQGKIAIPDAASSAYALAALATGVSSYTDMSDEEFQKASDFLRAIHPNVRFYWSDAGQLDQALASGEVEMGWGWNQSELNLIWNETPAVMMRDVNKGIATWVCGYVHLKSSKQPVEQVYDMLNALTSEASGKYIIESWGYAHSNADAFKSADQELIETYGFADVDSFFEGSLFFDAVKPELEAKMLKEFERIKAGF
ncbi:spermidine/putrescine ABC transporter substrate-binding protein [Ruegeria marisrubri]|uniref:Spermidine/putrescine ABC transporter substrate-binding protein n=1 Tax=Ruegeria marisrubri TaxID=1685379 RepID=A0A101CYJ6_9RHOB|nr:extracellular solute-binding protein [Ruegeria marisrubri]KUJ85707.1 spermidine/putrescine ABC transporter substrate-binding protein [Ruegeria marisrubri]